MLRRDFLHFTVGLGVIGYFPFNSFANHHNNTTILYACAKKEQHYFLIGSNLQGETLSQFQLPARGHGIATDQINQQAVVFCRRPGDYFIHFDPHTGLPLKQYNISKEKLFYGHGCFDHQGLLYASEGLKESSEASIGVYRLGKKIEKIDTFTGFGIGLHEIVSHPDGKHLILALGGIKTDKRKKLNLNTMKPQLIYINKNNGQIKQIIKLKNPQLSIRHLTVDKQGLVVFACQYQGEKELLPLIYTHQLGQKKAQTLNATEEQWLRFDDYIGSIAVSHNEIIATSPRGNCYAKWSKDNLNLIKIMSLNDACGVATNNSNFVLSSGSGEIGTLNKKQQTSWHWDNHMTVMTIPPEPV